MKNFKILMVLFFGSVLGVSAGVEGVCEMGPVQGVAEVYEAMPSDEEGVKALIKERFGAVIPVVFKGGARDWGVMKYDLEYMREHIDPRTEFGGREAAYPYLGGKINMNSLGEIGDHLEGIKEGGYELYLVESLREGLLRDVVKLEDFDYELTYEEGERLATLLIGGDTVFSGNHNHDSALLMMVDGRKHVYLSECNAVYMSRRQGDPGCPASGETFYELDFERNVAKSWFTDVGPGGEKSEYVYDWASLNGDMFYEVMLEEGDILYIPDYWYHAVMGVGPSLSWVL